MGTDLGRGQVPLSLSSSTNLTSTSWLLSSRAFSASWEVASGNGEWRNKERGMEEQGTGNGMETVLYEYAWQ